MIKTTDLTKRYGKTAAVDGASLNIPDKGCFALLGLNGAGKTTLLGMLSSSILPTSGSATIDGFDVVKDAKEVRKLINISPQESAVAKNLTVRENLELVADMYSIVDKNEQIDRLIDRFKLSDKQNERCKKLSGGQMRRVSIALALITQPRILFLDEPTLGLDVRARSTLWDIIGELKREMAVILTTHYLEEVEFLADEIAIISKGRIKAAGSRADICCLAGCESLEKAFLSLTEEDA